MEVVFVGNKTAGFVSVYSLLDFIVFFCRRKLFQTYKECDNWKL